MHKISKRKRQNIYSNRKSTKAIKKLQKKNKRRIKKKSNKKSDIILDAKIKNIITWLEISDF